MPRSFTDRIAGSLDHPVDIACGARPRGTIWTSALCAGAGAAIGSIAGGEPLWAGVGGGAGALLGYLIVWLRIRGTGLALGMALVLTPERLELHRVSGLGGRAAGLIRAVPYEEIRTVDVRERILELPVRIETAGEPIALETSKRGIGAAGPLLDELRRRIAA